MTTVATKTLELINRTMLADQGAAFRVLLKDLMPKADDAYRGDDPPFRNHLGASLIGRDCAREIWYGFRWCTLPIFDGRMLRLFNRGHLEEPRMVALLQMIGCTVWQYDARGKQFRISKGHKGHAGGGIDGVVKGVPDMPDVPMLAEFKTHGEKSFIKLKEDGVVNAKYEHYVQMQTYMGDLGLAYALYMAVNKNTDELYAEILQYNPMQRARFQQRTIMIVDATEAPPRIGKDETFFKCRFCDHKPVCHHGQPPVATCRSCSNVEIRDNSVWWCKRLDSIRTSEEQRLGCADYVVNPSIKA